MSPIKQMLYILPAVSVLEHEKITEKRAVEEDTPSLQCHDVVKFALISMVNKAILDAHVVEEGDDDDESPMKKGSEEEKKEEE